MKYNITENKAKLGMYIIEQDKNGIIYVYLNNEIISLKTKYKEILPYDEFKKIAIDIMKEEDKKFFNTIEITQGSYLVK